MAEFTAVKMTADGKVGTVQLSEGLSPLQGHVHGPIEVLAMKHGVYAIFNEEGTIYNLPPNFTASWWVTALGVSSNYGRGFLLLGDVLFAGNSDDGQFVTPGVEFMSLVQRVFDFESGIPSLEES